MRIFLAGIMQGSHVAALVHDQTYRNTLRDLVQAHWPEAEVYDPFANHATSVGYDMRRAREVFMGHIEQTPSSLLLCLPHVPPLSCLTCQKSKNSNQSKRLV